MVQQENDNIINNIPRLRWACRRGMLELDVLLGNYLNNAYLDLSLADKKLFVALLGQPDPEIFEWLMGHSHPEDPGLAHIVDKIRSHAKSRI
jgi:antitoxin CptB